MTANSTPRMLIIGNGGAAIHAIRALRSAGHTGRIHQVSDTPGPAFNPMLAPYYLKGMLRWEHCFPFGADVYTRNGVTCLFDDAAEHLDPIAKVCTLRSGKKIFYDKCLVATGAGAVLPPVPGLRESSRAFPLRTAAQLCQVQAAMAGARRAVVLGASLVGLKLAEIFRKHGIAVVLLDVADQLMPRGAHPRTAALLRGYLESKGIDIRLGCSLQGLEDTGRGVCCYFPEALLEEADFIAVCAGIRPNLNFLDPSVVKMGQAVLVDRHMRTNVPDLYAAGDVSQGYDRLSGQPQWLGTWINACCQGRVAGANMAGCETMYPGNIPQHISPVFDWVYSQLGDICLTGDNVRTVSQGSPYAPSGFRLLVFEEDRLLGANLINHKGTPIGALKNTIVHRRPWSGDIPLFLPHNRRNYFFRSNRPR
jgi:NADPH-dependent 2,4-dienoyl-CoA reductase/sulfur reductase-like enzyme